jgi:hypothetical protein
MCLGEGVSTVFLVWDGGRGHTVLEGTRIQSPRGVVGSSEYYNA